MCQTTTSTECIGCISNYFPDTAYPTASCSPCPFACAMCTSFTVCTACDVGFELVGNDCLCPSASSTYLNAAGNACLVCNQVIVNCNTCVHGIPTTCSGCDSRYSLSGDNLQCFACPLNCMTCSAGGVCTLCTLGYNWVSPDCVCDSSCLNCTNITGGACSACTNSTDCSACNAGWYLVGSTCTACLSEC